MKKINKKADIQSIAIIPIVLLIFGIMVVVSYMVLNKVTDSFEDLNSKGVIADQTVTIMQNSEASFIPTFDGLFMFVIVGLSLATVISAFYVNSHPAFFFIFAILLFLFAFVNAIITNVFVDVVSTGDLATSYANFPMMAFVWSKFPVIMFIVSIVIAIVMYAKGGNQG